MYECLVLMSDACQLWLRQLLPTPAGSLLMLGAIYLVAAVLSGLSGFGFSAVGSLSLLVLPPQLGVALLMGLSLIGQLASYRSLRSELRDARGAADAWRDGAWPYLLGGCLGLPAGLAVLGFVSASHLVTGLGVFLVSYSAWSLLKPAHLRLQVAQLTRQRGRAVCFGQDVETGALLLGDARHARHTQLGFGGG